MTNLELIQDLRAHAHEAPAQCSALMRRAARELEQSHAFVAAPTSVADINRRLAPAPVKGAPCR